MYCHFRVFLFDTLYVLLFILNGRIDLIRIMFSDMHVDTVFNCRYAPLGAWDGLRYLIVALREPSIQLFCLDMINLSTLLEKLLFL